MAQKLVLPTLEDCSIGLFMKEDCRKLSYTRQLDLCQATNCSPDERNLILRRTRIPQDSFVTLCIHHKVKYSVKYASFQHTCCNPFNIHKSKISSKSIFVLLSTYVVLYNIFYMYILKGALREI